MKYGLYRSIIGFDGRVLRTEFVKGDLAFADIIGCFRLNEMLLYIKAHEDRAKIADLIIILYFVDRYVFDFQFGYHKHGRIKSGFDTKVDFLCVGTFHFICVTILGESCASYRHPTEKNYVAQYIHGSTFFFISSFLHSSRISLFAGFGIQVPVVCTDVYHIGDKHIM